jgi:hypothetical protein
VSPGCNGAPPLGIAAATAITTRSTMPSPRIAAGSDARDRDPAQRRAAGTPRGRLAATLTRRRLRRRTDRGMASPEVAHPAGSPRERRIQRAPVRRADTIRRRRRKFTLAGVLVHATDSWPGWCRRLRRPRRLDRAIVVAAGLGPGERTANVSRETSHRNRVRSRAA